MLLSFLAFLLICSNCLTAGVSNWSPSHDHEILLRPDGPLARRRRLSDGVFGSGLDYFGTNQGLVLRSDVTSSSSAGSEADDSNSDSEPAQDCELRLASTAAAVLPQHVQTHIDDQADHIAQLEVDNAKLSDENINLKEVPSCNIKGLPRGTLVRFTLRL